MSLPLEITNIPSSRCALEKKQSRLMVDYYRIRRKISFPLPLDQFYLLKIPSKSISGYPWSIWMVWRLEERFHALYNGYFFQKDQASGELLQKELGHFAKWTTYNELKSQPDLSTGHCGRLLFKALQDWQGISEELKDKLKVACKGLVEENFPKFEEYYKEVSDIESIKKLKNPRGALHNIGFIGSIGTAMAAYCIGDNRYKIILEKLKIVVKALAWFSKEKGYSEGIAYDGYMYDFLLDLMPLYSKEDCKELLDTEIVHNIMNQVIHSAVSGNPSARAEIGDVESKEMTFDIVALIKFQKYFSTEGFAWYIQNVCPTNLRSDGVSQLLQLPNAQATALPPKKQVLRLPATIALRSGWGADDITVIVSACNSTAGHIQNDAGTVVIGTRGSWLINDPGYQQYMESSEREFTLGLQAHNFPLVNQVNQKSKNVKIVSLEEGPMPSVELDMTNCYAEGHVKNVRRKIWILDKNRIAIRDLLEGESVESVSYTWHGHPEGYNYVNDWGLVQHDEGILWFRCLGHSFSPSNLTRLRGSRGSLSFSRFLPKPSGPLWWVFTSKETEIDKPTQNPDGSLLWGKDKLL